MPAWLIWALAAVLLAVGEIFTPGLFFLGPVALAAVAAAVVALVGLGVAIGAGCLLLAILARRLVPAGLLEGADGRPNPGATAHP